ncbi:MAG: PorT family protein [Muribaculaceae bacterium]|nr:PorT family protein [Muribaculaceae bacterium]
MKNFKRLLIAVIAIVALTMPAHAEFKIGPRVGLTVNSLKFSDDLWSSDNRAGFTGGLQVEFTAPVIGIGMDASVMYVRRDSKFYQEDANGETSYTNLSKDWIEIPLNLKWKINIIGIGKIIKPYIFTGPSFAFLTSSKAISEAWESKKFDVSWNFGFGAELINHLQIGASYGIGMTKAAKHLGISNGGDVTGRNKYWTVTAAWLF